MNSAGNRRFKLNFNVYADQGWVAGEFPPGRYDGNAGMYRVLSNMRNAHDQAYRELRRITPAVRSVSHMSGLIQPADAESRTDRTAAVAA